MTPHCNHCRLVPVLACLCFAWCLPVEAQATLTDLQVAARALGFMQKPLVGEVQVGIVYTPGDAASTKEAEDLLSAAGGGLRVGNVLLQPVLVKASELGTANVGLYFLVSGVDANAAHLADWTEQKHIPCVTTDIAQVRKGACFMGVRSKPKIEILVNRAAAARSGVTFSAVFRIMITEL